MVPINKEEDDAIFMTSLITEERISHVARERGHVQSAPLRICPPMYHRLPFQTGPEISSACAHTAYQQIV